MSRRLIREEGLLCGQSTTTFVATMATTPATWH